MEQLIIRLAGTGKAQWLIWKPSPAELIASGELANWSELSQLTDHARSRNVVVFVSSSEVILTQAKLPSSALRMLPQVVPNALEDELAQDINELHFAWPPVKKSDTDALPVAVVAQQQMQQWLDALAAADIHCEFIYPDLYMLPTANSKLMIDDEVIVRYGDHAGFCGELSVAEQVLAMLQNEQPELVLRRVEDLDIEVPFTIAALSLNDRNQPPMINLRQQQYRPQRKQRRTEASSFKWKWPALAATVALLLGYSSKVIDYVALGQESEQLRAAIENTYREVFPNEQRIVNVRSQLNRHLSSVGTSAVSTSPLHLLQALEPAFKAQPDVRLQLLRYDSNTLRLQVNATSFASLENFRKVANSGGAIQVEQGPTSNQAGAIQGSLTVKHSG